VLVFPTAFLAALLFLAEPVHPEEGKEKPVETRSDFFAMGSRAECRFYGADRECNRRIERNLMDLLARIEKSASFYDPDSEVNRLPRGAWVPVSGELMEMLTVSKRLHEATGGVFDISLGTLKVLWDSTRRSHTMPTEAEIEIALRTGGMEKIEILAPLVRISDASLRIDLSGIAKGYAVDRGIELLKASGAVGGMINLGGDIGVFGVSGADGARKWEIGIQDPRPGGRILGHVLLENEAIATSGDYERFAIVQDRRFGHIFNPKARGFSAAGAVRSVTIVHPSCAHADALATAVFAMGAEKGVAYLEQAASASGYLILWETGGSLECRKKMRILDFALPE
jgi:thiamine biosynthesis lipoprotein